LARLETDNRDDVGCGAAIIMTGEKGKTEAHLLITENGRAGTIPSFEE
jgi:hypothetical protein